MISIYVLAVLITINTMAIYLTVRELLLHVRIVRYFDREVDDE